MQVNIAVLFTAADNFAAETMEEAQSSGKMWYHTRNTNGKLHLFGFALYFTP